MKRTGILIALFLCSVVNQAQEQYKKSLSGIKQVHIQVNTSVKLIVGNSNEILITKDTGKNGHDARDYDHKVSDEAKKKKNDKAKGLKAIYAGGEDNTGFGMYYEVDGNVLKIKDLKSFTQRRGFIITMPKHIALNLNCGNLGSANIKGLSSEIEVKTNVGKLELLDVTGPVTARTNTGDIKVKFSVVNQSSPISISSSTGNIDVHLPIKTKANLALRTTMGTASSDFNLEESREDGMKRIGNLHKIEGKINNGGVKIILRSSIGNVSVKKN